MFGRATTTLGIGPHSSIQTAFIYNMQGIQLVMGVDPRKNVEGTLPSLVCSPLPLEVAPLKSS